MSASYIRILVLLPLELEGTCWLVSDTSVTIADVADRSMKAHYKTSNQSIKAYHVADLKGAWNLSNFKLSFQPDSLAMIENGFHGRMTKKWDAQAKHLCVIFGTRLVAKND